MYFAVLNVNSPQWWIAKGFPSIHLQVKPAILLESPCFSLPDFDYVLIISRLQCDSDIEVE